MSVETNSVSELAHHRYIVLSLTYGSGFDSVELLLTCMSEAERSTYERIASRPRQIQFLLGRVLVKQTVGRVLQIPARDVPIVASAGRPRIAPEGPAREMAKLLDFNIAHCLGHVLVALTVHGKVGVDVEIEDRFFNSALRFLNEEESKSVSQLPPEKRAGALCHFWTVKEACVKAVGQGLGFPLPDIPVSAGRSGRSLGMQWDAIGLTPTAKAAIALLPRNGEVPPGPGRISESSIEALLEDWDLA